MNITEKKASEKARKIYEKLDIYNRYMSKKREEERKKKEKEDYEKYQELLKNNPKLCTELEGLVRKHFDIAKENKTKKED